MKSYIPFLIILGSLLIGCKKEEEKVQPTEIYKKVKTRTFTYEGEEIEDLLWITEEYPPYNFKDENGVTQGISIELLEATLKHMKIPNTRKDFKVWPWSRGYKFVQKEGKINCIFSTTRTKARENLFKWFGPIADNTVAVIGLKDSKNINSNKELSKYRYVGIRDDIGVLTLKKLGVPKEKITSVTTIKQLVGMLKKKRVDYIVYNINVLFYTMKNLGFDTSEFEGKLNIDKGVLWFAVNKSVSDKTVTAYQKALDIVSNKPSVKKVLLTKFGIK